MIFDYLIVGAGIAGITAAERLCAAGFRCLIVDKRNHIGGNCYDYYDAAGVLIHKYGPHYFRSNSQRIVDYLTQFTDWRPVAYSIKSFTKGKHWSFPINLNTFEELIGRKATEEEFIAYLEEKRVKIANCANSEEVILSQVGQELYELFFEGYTIKQWACHPKELDASVCGRIPLRTNRDDRYLTESFQALPADGYTAMFQRMIDSCGTKLTISLDTDWRTLYTGISWKHMIYTGPIDEFYSNCFGALPYRSLRFEYESFSNKEFYQPAMQVNFPDADVPYTRIVEIKHATGQQIDATTIVREYPKSFEEGDERFYPIPRPDTAELYAKYRTLAEQEKDVSFIGRLATYRYYNMDQVVGMALAEVAKLTK